VNLSAANGTVPNNFSSTNTGTFGQISTAGNMRQLQIGLRLTF